MNSAQIASLLRTFVQIGGTIAVARGWVDAETAATLGDQIVVLGGALAVIAATAWGLYARRNTALVASAAALPQVAQIVTTSPRIADAAGPKVTAL